MKKTMMLLFFALFLGIGGTDAKANVFASLVDVDFTGTFPATISYNLNQDATSVVIAIKDFPGGNVVKTITIQSGNNGALVGFNDVAWDGSLDLGGTASSGIFTIEIDASDDVGSSGFELTSFDTGPDSWYWSSSGVAANKRQTSPDFGRVYVTERTGGTSGNPGGIATPKGLYLHDSFGRYHGFQQNIAFAEGNSVIDWTLLATDEGAPFGATIGPDDRVYLWVLASNRDTPKHGGVAVGDALWSASSVETILDFDDLSSHNTISDAIVVGEGAGRMLYTVEQTSARTGSDNDSAIDGDGFDTSEIKRYALGETGGLFSGSGDVVIPTATMKNAFRIEMDSDGFLYVAQQSYASLAVADNIFGLSKWDISGTSPVEIWHVNLDAAPPHNDAANALNAQATNFNGLALDEPRGRVYVTRKNAVRPLNNVLGYTMDTGNFWASFAASQSIVGTDTTDLPGGGGSSIRDVDVDAAGNVLIVNSSFEALRMYSPPDGPNNFNTFSPWAIDLDNSTVIPTPEAVTVAWCDSTLGKISGARDTVYVCVDDVTGLDIISYQLVVTFDESVLDAITATGEGTITEGFGPPTVNTSVNGQITVGGFGTNVLQGAGRFLCLIFDVVGNPGDTTDLCIQSMLFNAGDPTANVPNPCCPYPVINEFDISGGVTYCPTDGAVGNTTLTLSGGASDTRLTDSNGAYVFEKQTGGVNYTVTPSKTDDINLFVISCFDAALAARIAVGLDQADHCDSLAADVDEDGNIFTFDAALICRNAVGLPPFGENDKTGEWRFEPTDRSYSPLDADQTAQDFTAILLGDVDGNWTPAQGGGTVLAKGGASRIKFVDKPGWSADGNGMTTRLHFDGGVSALAFELEFSYDATALSYSEVAGAPEGWQVFVNSEEPGRLVVGMFSTTPLAQAAEFVGIEWDVLKKGVVTELVLERAVVNDEPQATTSLTTQLNRIPMEFTLHQNYPNPFNPETTIRYDLPEPAAVRLVIYNLKGQEIRRLVDEEQEAGFHTVTWDGKEQAGRRVASGVYVYRIEAGKFRAVRKLTLLR